MSDNIITTVITVVLLLREAIHQLQDPAAVLLVRTVPKLMGRLVFLQLSIQKCNTANCTANYFISHDESFHFPSCRLTCNGPMTGQPFQVTIVENVSDFLLYLR